MMSEFSFLHQLFFEVCALSLFILMISQNGAVWETDQALTYECTKPRVLHSPPSTYGLICVRFSSSVKICCLWLPVSVRVSA